MQWAVLMSVLAGISTILGIANMIWTWMSKGGARAADHERRIQAIESELQHLPSKDDITNLRLQLTELNGRMGTFDAELASIARTTRRIEDHLLKEGA
jgi:hypothetical protein